MYLIGGFFRNLLFAADTQQTGQRLRELDGARADDDRGGWRLLLFRLRVYVMVMVVVVVVMIRWRLGIHYADGREGRRAAERIVGSTTTASRHDANRRCWHVSFDFFFVFKAARTWTLAAHEKHGATHALIEYRWKIIVKKKKRRIVRRVHVLPRLARKNKFFEINKTIGLGFEKNGRKKTKIY